MKQQEKGIAHLGMILTAVLVLAAVAFGGWYVWEKNRNESSSSNTTQNGQAEKNEKEPAKIVPEGWKFYKNDEAGFSFYYPPEWGNVTQGEVGRYLFSKLPGASFKANLRDKEPEQGDSVQADAVDVSQRDNSVVVTSVTGVDPPTIEKIFTGDGVIKTLPNSRACVLDDVNMYEFSGNPDGANLHVYIGYCGLLHPKYGAFVFSSNSHDITNATTQQLKEDIYKLLQTFEVY